MKYLISILALLLSYVASPYLQADESDHCAERNLHAPPGIIGKIAAQTNTKKLVLSHFMARSLQNLEENLEEIHSRYPGTVVIAQDLECIEI